MKRSCLRWLLLYFVLAGGAAALVYERFPQLKIALIGGAAGGLFLWFSLAYLIGIRSKKSEAHLIRKALYAGIPEDNERCAVVGTVSAASSESFESPITKRRCLCYEYKAGRPGDDSQNVWAVYEGFALAPLSIDGPRGSIRLLGKPDLPMPFETFGMMDQYANLRNYVETTEFQVREGIHIRRELNALKEVLADDDGRIRYDIQRSAAPDVSSMVMQEKVLQAGEPVCAIGRYSAARGGLVPDPASPLEGVKILRGSPEDVAKSAKRSGCEGVLAIGCLLPVVVAALAALALVPLDAIEQMFPKKDPSWPEVRLERWVRRTITPIATRMSGDLGTATINLEPGEARGKVTIGRTTTYLTHAVATRTGDTVELTLDDRVKARFKEHKLTFLQLPNGDVVPPGEVEVEGLEIADTYIVGRMTYLTPADGPKLRVAFRAKIPEVDSPPS